MSNRAYNLPAVNDQAGWQQYAHDHPFYVAPAHGETDYSRSDELVIEVQELQAPDDDERAGFGQVKDIVFALVIALPLICLLLYFHPWG